MPTHTLQVVMRSLFFLRHAVPDSMCGRVGFVRHHEGPLFGQGFADRPRSTCNCSIRRHPARLQGAIWRATSRLRTPRRQTAVKPLLAGLTDVLGARTQRVRNAIRLGVRRCNRPFVPPLCYDRFETVLLPGGIQPSLPISAFSAACMSAQLVGGGGGEASPIIVVLGLVC